MDLGTTFDREATEHEPFVTPALVGWHLIFGAVLGGLFPVLEGA